MRRHYRFFALVLAAVLATAAYVSSAEALRPTTPTNGDRQEGFADEAANHSGRGESLILVVGGVYETRTEAEAAAALSQTEVQGFYVASAGDFQLLDTYAQISADRTELDCSASDFMERARKMPELAQISERQLRWHCGDQGGRLSVVRDVQLSREEGSCQEDSPCRAAARAGLGSSMTWPDGDEWIVASAFRTLPGSQEHMTYLRDVAQVPAFAVRVLRERGETDLGLGQEAHPDGSGPLVGPLPNQTMHQ